ncbi:MAG TPA: OB-fold nucleic acid binding domain-containing protein, partial [Candidatus Thermoplasmatota archaeon]|nr:OB-fold nucleic acid binding domain-containing protein [Candidatus Thermoplasmatota archaeon]
RPVRETLFLTNQGTDDHLREKRAAECHEHDSARVRGRVAARPEERNGTVLFELRDESGAVRCAAYPPTRGFRHVARALDEGDDVTACGGLHVGPDGRLTLGLEKLHVHETVPRRAGAPTCPSCGRAMDSAGKGAGFRCRHCHTRAAEARTAVSVVRPGWHEVPASARRHLAMPLRRPEALSPRP